MIGIENRMLKICAMIAFKKWQLTKVDYPHPNQEPEKHSDSY